MRKLTEKQIEALKKGRVKGIKRPSLRIKRPWFIPWNKGLKGIHLSKKSEWKKGETPKGSILFKKGQESWNKGKILGRGEKSYNWKGGRTLHQNKYWLIHSPNHPFADGKGYVREHRLVIEKYIGRYLDKTELVHHLNENTKDNRIENLMIVNRSNHIKYHREMLIKNRWNKL